MSSTPERRLGDLLPDGEPHQLAALSWLNDQLTPEQLREFWETFDAAPPVKAPYVPSVIAWGPSRLMRTPAGHLIRGRQFELLPGGTMQNSSTMLHGVIGVQVKRCGDVMIPIDGPNVLLMGLDETPSEALLSYQVELVDGLESRDALEVEG